MVEVYRMLREVNSSLTASRKEGNLLETSSRKFCKFDTKYEAGTVEAVVYRQKMDAIV